MADSMSRGMRRTQAAQQKRAGNDPQSVIRRNQTAKDDEYKSLVASRPDFMSARGPNGDLKSEFKGQTPYSNVSQLQSKMDAVQGIKQPNDVKAQDVNAGKDFANAQGDLGKLRSRAFGTGPSAWAQARGQLADADHASAQNNAIRDQARSATSMRNQAMMQGGFDRGAAMRMNKAAARDRIRAVTDLNASQMRNKLSISGDDEAQRMQLQQQMPGMGTQMDAYNTGLQNQNANRDFAGQQFNAGMNMQTQQSNADLGMKKAGMWGTMADGEAARAQQNSQFNAGNALQDLQGQNQHGMEGWNTKMGVYGANRTADAQAAAAKPQKPGLLGQVFGGIL